jgi:GAF domain-containing protein/ANTAR domain-containing protein
VTDLAALKQEIEAALGLSGPEAAVAVCRACVGALPGDGAAITVMTSDSRRETVFAGDPVISDLEHLQYTVGEGPTLQAFSTGHPVLVTDLRDRSTAVRWPGLVASLDGQPARAVFSFPMRFGAINVGVCVLYRLEPEPLTSADLAFVLSALDLCTLALLELRDGQPAGPLLGIWLAVDGSRRREVHQATGMLMMQLGVPAETAFARLRGYAFAHDRDIEQVASEILNRRIRLEPDPTPGTS